MILTAVQAHNDEYFAGFKKGISYHPTSNMHRAAEDMELTADGVTQLGPIKVKAEIVFNMLKHTLPRKHFIEQLNFIHILQQYYNVKDVQVLSIGDKCVSDFEYRKIETVFQEVIDRQILKVLHSPPTHYKHCDVIFYSLAVDAWSKGMLYSFLTINSIDNLNLCISI